MSINMSKWSGAVKVSFFLPFSGQKELKQQSFDETIWLPGHLDIFTAEFMQ